MNGPNVRFRENQKNAQRPAWARSREPVNHRHSIPQGAQADLAPAGTGCSLAREEWDG